MSNLKAQIEELNQMVLTGQAMEAFEKFYADDVVMQENENTPVTGKEANRQREIDFFNNLTEFRGAEVKRIAVGDNTTMVEWFMDYTHKEWGDRKFHQIAVQKWDNGKIVQEKFYYGV